MSATPTALLAKPAQTAALNRKRVEALARALKTVVQAHKFTAPRGNGGAVIGEELNALALAVADVIRQAPGSEITLRAWFASTLVKIMEAPRPPEGHG